MRVFLGLLMISNAAVFFFGAAQHAGVAIGPFHEPRIVGAAIVETVCGLALAWGAGAVLRRFAALRRRAMIANFVALAGVLFGIAALAMGGGPRTASNDLYHGVMLALAGASLVILFFGSSVAGRNRP